MRIRPTALRALAVTLALGAAIVAAPASAASIGGIGVRPATFDPAQPATRAYFILHVAGGRAHRGAAIVTNTTGSPVRLQVDPVDGLTGVTSGVVYANRGTPVHGAGEWVMPATRTLTVPAHGSAREPFVVTVPPGAAPGDHVAGLAFQLAHSRRSGGNFSVTIVVRAVIGVQVIVPGHAVARARLLKLALAPLPGTTDPSAVVTLEDVGGLLCQPRLTVSIAGTGSAHRTARTLSTILPGDRIAFPFAWPGGLAAGRYRVSARVTHCGPPVARSALSDYTPSGTITQASTSTGSVAPTSPLASASGGGGSWWLYVLVAAGALLAGAGLATVMRRRSAR